MTRLIGIGTFVTWGLSTIAAWAFVGFSWPVSFLVAALLVVTGPTVIGPLLSLVRPKRSVNSILKWEGIVIDPVGAILAVLVFGVFFGHGHGDHTLGWGKPSFSGSGLATGPRSDCRTSSEGTGFPGIFTLSSFSRSEWHSSPCPISSSTNRDC